MIESIAISAVMAKKPVEMKVDRVWFLMNPSSSTATAMKMKYSASVKRASTKSRVKAFAGPRSRAGRYFSSPAAMPSRARTFAARSASRWADFAAFGSLGVFMNCLRVRWASLREGVGRPLVPPWVSSVAGVVACELSLLPRPNMGEA